MATKQAATGQAATGRKATKHTATGTMPPSPVLESSPQQQTFAFWEPADAAPKRAVTTTSVSTKTEAPKTSPSTLTSPSAELASSPQESSRPQKGSRHAPSCRPLPPEKPPQQSPQANGTRSVPATLAQPSRQSLLQQLRHQANEISDPTQTSTRHFHSTGSATLDSWLPGGGLPLGAISEWIATTPGGGAGTLALLAAAQTIGTNGTELDTDRAEIDRRRSFRERTSESHFRGAKGDYPTSSGPIVIVDPEHGFYPPAAVACGIPPERIVWCRPENRRDTLWTLDQALRCRAVAAVWASLPWHFDDRDARRLQLASETGCTPGLLVRQASAGSRPSFAATRWHVAAVNTQASSQALAASPIRTQDARVVQVKLDRARGTSAGRQAWLAITAQNAGTGTLQTLDSHFFTRSSDQTTRHEAVAVHLASELARPATARRPDAKPKRRRAS